ncbi:MAG: hypothetical protein KUG79_14235 [Pseudomonadales bacterium]|nr:hypothetical protein [Pseudomonadales bacterium]
MQKKSAWRAIGPMQYLTKAIVLSALSFIAMVTSINAIAAPLLFGIHPFQDDSSILHQIDPTTGADINSIDLSLAGSIIRGGNGLAVDPTTGIMYAILKLQGQSTRELVTIDPVTGIATSIGDTGLKIAGLTFDASGQLFGVTGDGATPAETLFKLNKTNASTSLFLTLGAGEDGEAIAYNPTDGLIYHSSGPDVNNLGLVFESIDLITKTTTEITLSGDSYQEFFGMVYDVSQDLFLATDINKELFSITTSGLVTSLGTIDIHLRGLAFWDDGTAVPAPPALGLFGLGLILLSMQTRKADKKKTR